MKIKEIIRESGTSGGSTSGDFATFVRPGAGTLFGGSFEQRDNPFRKPAKVKKAKARKK
jgi:hypothetical protein